MVRSYNNGVVHKYVGTARNMRYLARHVRNCPLVASSRCELALVMSEDTPNNAQQRHLERETWLIFLHPDMDGYYMPPHPTVGNKSR